MPGYLLARCLSPRKLLPSQLGLKEEGSIAWIAEMPVCSL